MNHESQSTTRWSCRLVRMFGGDAESAHVAQCSDCQRYFGRVDQLETALRRDARVPRAAVPAGLDARILRALEQENAPARRRPVARFPALVLGAGTACVALTAWLVWGAGGRGDQVVTELPAGRGPASLVSLATLTPTVESVVSEGSLQNEVDSVYADAQSAAHFLALNFLPTASPDPARHDEQSTAPVRTG
jgi:hypothetical protein